MLSKLLATGHHGFRFSMMMVIFLDEAQAAVAADVIAGFVLHIRHDTMRGTDMIVSYGSYQVDVHLGMTQGTIASVAEDNALSALLGRHLLDELDAPVLVHIPLGIHKSGIAVVVLIEHLKLTSVYYISLYIFHTMFA